MLTLPVTTLVVWIPKRNVEIAPPAPSQYRFSAYPVKVHSATLSVNVDPRTSAWLDEMPPPSAPHENGSVSSTVHVDELPSNRESRTVAPSSE